MTGRRVWTRPGGRVLAWQRDGWPTPAGYREVAEQAAGAWSWSGFNWPCHHPTFSPCQRRAVWRTDDGRTRGYYCGAHLPHAKPTEAPAGTCPVCTGPMDPWLTRHGYTAHICCAYTRARERSRPVTPVTRLLLGRTLP